MSYIQKISEYCREIGDRYGRKLLELMDKYKVNSLREITEEQAKEFYEELKNKKEKGI